MSMMFQWETANGTIARMANIARFIPSTTEADVMKLEWFSSSPGVKIKVTPYKSGQILPGVELSDTVLLIQDME